MDFIKKILKAFLEILIEIFNDGIGNPSIKTKKPKERKKEKPKEKEIIYIKEPRKNYLEKENENEYEKPIFENAETKGYNGEIKIALELKKIREYNHCKILRNVYVPTKDSKTSEIDIILISHNGIFVIESKNYTGTIYGSSDDFRWTCFSKARKKYPMYNPKKQNETHIKHLKEFLNMPHLDDFKSYIVFSNECTLKLKGENYRVIHIENFF